MSRIRVLVGEDDPSVRSALSDLIAADPRFELVAVAADTDQAIDLAADLRPDVALIDVKMPGGGGSHATLEIKARSPQTRVVALSAYEDRATVLEMLHAGAISYLVKGAPTAKILEAVRLAAHGQSSLSEEVTADVVKELASHLDRERQTSDETERLHARIGRVLSGGEMTMVFQPIVDIQTGERVGFEALARFSGPPDRGPEAWFAEAHQVGRRRELELAAAEAALGSLGRIEPGAFLAVNLSPGVASSPEWMAMARGVGPRLVMEITEHAPVEDYEGLTGDLAPVRSLGVRLAIDDAGAGFASLRHILALAPDFIKLDITLTRDIDSHQPRRALASALITFAADIGSSIVAEGVETDAEMQTLRTLGASFAQGFSIARPAPFPKAGRQGA